MRTPVAEPNVETARRRWPARLFVLAAVLAVGVWATIAWIERSAEHFIAVGRGAVVCLDHLAKAAQARDRAGIEALYASDFRGQSLGLGHLGAARDKDGVRVLPLVAAGPLSTREAALGEWQAYLDSFSSIGEVRAHVNRLEDWSGEDVVASVRFELIGTPTGAPRAGIDRATFRMRFRPSAGAWVIAEAQLLEGDRTIAERAQFTEVGHAAGIDFVNQYYPRFLSEPLRFKMLRFGPAGITAADVDDDGYYDLFIPDGVASKLFRNRGDGTFEDITERSGLAGLDGVSVGTFADYDNDGFKDFFVSRTFNPNQLFHNNGDGTFTDVTKKSGIGADCCTTVAGWADYDNDGFLDLYVGRYLDPRTQFPEMFYARNGEPNQLYHNNGDGTFTNVTEKAGVGEKGLCLGVVWGDYDDDGDPDLYVVNDFGRNTLYRNEGGGVFKDVSLEANALAYGAGMSASFGDYDNDGKLDIYVANILPDVRWFAEPPTARLFVLNALRQGVFLQDMHLYREIYRQSGFHITEVFQQMASGNSLLRNRGDGTFEDVSAKAGANPPGWFWGSGFADFDNDGWQDIYAADGWAYQDNHEDVMLDFYDGVTHDQRKYKTGWFYEPANWGGRSWHGWERNRHLRNNGDGTFSEIGTAAGTDLLLNSRGIAVADFWNRGVLDIAVAASTDHHALLRNEVGGARHWWAIELTGAGSAKEKGTNRDAVGARVVIKSGGRTQMRELVLGDGYGAQNTMRQYFGLGDVRVVDEVTVAWPRSGLRQTFRNLEADHIYQLTEDKTTLSVRR